ncbi:hypothetical protein NDU88_000424 [Pleurodeles waltl]|uniref:Uncharacterized protein n=1 Tax=Pleurodeles waltl TaxID=8319 RepID=A0AAV7WFH3_PLEWA|nr:hypothetical protein NDU88_000424 [Pleurodeles waltl]
MRLGPPPLTQTTSRHGAFNSALGTRGAGGAAERQYNHPCKSIEIAQESTCTCEEDQEQLSRSRNNIRLLCANGEKNCDAK